MLPSFLRAISVPTLAGGLAVGAQFFMYGSAPRVISSIDRLFTSDSLKSVAGYGVLFGSTWVSSMIGETLNSYALPALLKATNSTGGAVGTAIRGAGNLLLEPALVGGSNMVVSKFLFQDANVNSTQYFIVGAASNLAANFIVRGSLSAFTGKM